MLLSAIHRLNLNAIEKRTFRLHFLYSCLEGILAGVLILNEFVFIKSLNGSAYQLGLLFQFSVLVFLLLIFINEFLKRIKNQKRFLRLVGILTRAPLFLLLLFPRSSEAMSGNSIFHYLFLFIFLVYCLAWPVVYPTINRLLKNAYEHVNFGVLYGYSTAANRILMLLTTFVYGLLLDKDNFAFTWVFPVMAVLGMVSVYLLSMIENRRMEDSVSGKVESQQSAVSSRQSAAEQSDVPQSAANAGSAVGNEFRSNDLPLEASSLKLEAKENMQTIANEQGQNKSGFWQSVLKSALSMIGIVRKNGSYRHFEIAFMLYGFAFMISNTVITLFFERVLHLNYSSVAFYKNAFNILAIIMLPFFGRLMGSMDPRRFGVFSFLAMLLSVLFIALSQYVPVSIDLYGIKIFYMLIVYVIFMGIFTASIQILWYIGSAYFCSTQEAGDYQSVHLILTGVRGMIAPTGGVFLYELAGFTWTFIISMLLLLAAIGVMMWSYRRDRNIL
jgi:Na+/melibiose symporter-like transporter